MDTNTRARAAAEAACGCRDCFARGGAPWPKGEWPETGCWADRLMAFAADAMAQAVKERDEEIIRLRADIVWIAKQRDDNEQWARDRAAVAIQMADERDAKAKQAEEIAWKHVVQIRNKALDKAEEEIARLRARLDELAELRDSP